MIISESEEIIKTISVSEAIMLMNLNDQNAIFFKNTQSKRLNILFRRSDGNIGWLDPIQKNDMKLNEFISLGSIYVDVDADSVKKNLFKKKYQSFFEKR